MKVRLQDVNAWIQDLERIHASLDKWYKFAVGFIGERKQLLEAKEGIDKLKKLIEFLDKLKVELSTRDTTSD